MFLIRKTASSGTRKDLHPDQNAQNPKDFCYRELCLLGGADISDIMNSSTIREISEQELMEICPRKSPASSARNHTILFINSSGFICKCVVFCDTFSATRFIFFSEETIVRIKE